MNPAPPKSPPPKLSGPPQKTSSQAKSPAKSKLKVVSGRQPNAHRVVVFGTGGIGKSELLSLVEHLGIRVLFFDLEEGTNFLSVDRVVPESYEELMEALADQELIAPYGAVAIDSFTKLEEMCAEHVCRTIENEKGKLPKGIEGYGYGKGYSHIGDAFVRVLVSLDKHVRAGRHVLCTAHECTEKKPNPAGEDWLEYQPRLQSPPKAGKVRERVREWCDHLLYIGYDIEVRGGRGIGAGTRTIHTAQMPTHWAKSRVTSDPLPYVQGDPQIWHVLFGG